MKMYYDNRNDQIYCRDAFGFKDTLKGMGFQWNGMDKSWYIARPQNISDLANLICDVAVNCKLDYYDLCDFVSLSLPSEYADVLMHMDEAHISKLQAAIEG